MFDAGPCFGMFTVLPRAMRVEYPGTIYHVMVRADRREDILLIGTAQAAKSLLHHLAHEPPQHRSARMNKAVGQLEFQSTADPFPDSPSSCLIAEEIGWATDESQGFAHESVADQPVEPTIAEVAAVEMRQPLLCKFNSFGEGDVGSSACLDR
jgi:hypothetical protein